MMRALRYTEIGGACGVGEIVVDMAYAALNAIDAQIWRGVGGLSPSLPHVLGIEGSGWLDGKPVMIFGQGAVVVRHGAAAEQAVFSHATLYLVPEGVDPAAAAVCGATGATAV
jgi:NADPH2:quinone reductase